MKCPYCNYESNVMSDVCVNCKHELKQDNESKEAIKKQLNAYKWYSGYPTKRKSNESLKNVSKLTRAKIQEDRPLYKVWVQTSCEEPCHTLTNHQKVPLDDDFLVVNDTNGAISKLSYPGEYGNNLDNTMNCSCQIEFTDNPDGVLTDTDKDRLFAIARTLQNKQGIGEEFTVHEKNVKASY